MIKCFDVELTSYERYILEADGDEDENNDDDNDPVTVRVAPRKNRGTDYTADDNDNNETQDDTDGEDDETTDYTDDNNDDEGGTETEDTPDEGGIPWHYQKIYTDQYPHSWLSLRIPSKRPNRCR